MPQSFDGGGTTRPVTSASGPQSTSNAAQWRPGMIYISPITGARTTDPANVPGTAQHAARQASAQEARYTGGTTPVVTAPASRTGSGGAVRPAASGSFGAVSGDGGAAAAAAAARAEADGQANNGARSGANNAKSASQQQIDAANAQKQVNQNKLDALTELTSTGLAKGRDTAIAGVGNDLKLLLDQAFANYSTTLGDLNTGLRDNEKSESDSSFSNLANRAREKGDLVGQALSQGAGESDILKTQLQALRNWNANQGEINRSYFDTLTSANSGINDLNVGTSSAITGYEMDANQRKAGVWQDFYAGQADAYTQMDNLSSNNWLLDKEIGASSSTMSAQDQLIAWLDAGKNAADFVAPVAAAAAAGEGPFKGFAAQAAANAGAVWENPGVSQATKDWKGQAPVVASLNNSQPWAAQTNESVKAGAAKKPEGATLRKW